jgi:hypothetical protein
MEMCGSMGRKFKEMGKRRWTERSRADDFAAEGRGVSRGFEEWDGYAFESALSQVSESRPGAPEFRGRLAKNIRN